jgi:hypothetical protein
VKLPSASFFFVPTVRIILRHNLSLINVTRTVESAPNYSGWDRVSGEATGFRGLPSVAEGLVRVRVWQAQCPIVWCRRRPDHTWS